ncbi:cytochrome b5 type B [Drosophila grimshawi]|uniref:cytochrome b5 type B n=1 Tax=Drosophila grimshawi TaxID=7222 RepID=UPI001C933FD0|nr:cytochrome b5 type B [Drosophila grimshawi]
MSQIYQKSEVAERNGKNGKPVWIIYKGNVYDVTDFIKDHPGGDDVILEVAGKDATKAFNSAGHSQDALDQLKEFKIGEVSPIDEQPRPQTAPAKSAQSTKSELPEVTQAEKSSGGFLCCC